MKDDTEIEENLEDTKHEQGYKCLRCDYINPLGASFCFVCGEPLLTETKIPDYELDWTPEMDDLLKKRFDNASVDDLQRELDRRFGLSIPEMLIFRRSEALGLVGKKLVQLRDEQKPNYLQSNVMWMQGAETARVKGDVSIPRNEVVPYNIIVEGNLVAQSNVVFQGGLHVKGTTVLGDKNTVMKSLICEKEVIIGRNTVLENCVDADGSIFVRRGVIVGTGNKGGIASGENVYVELGFSGKTKVYAPKGIQIVKNIHEVLPKRLKDIIGRERAIVDSGPQIVSVRYPETRPIRSASIETLQSAGHPATQHDNLPSEEIATQKMRLQSVEESPASELSKTELQALKLIAQRESDIKIALLLGMDLFQVETIIEELIKNGYIEQDYGLTELGVNKVYA
jgi:hypothetical protein